MLEPTLGNYKPSSTEVPGWPDVEAPSPRESELSRHVYAKGGIPRMMVCKLADGSEERFYLFKNSFEARWIDMKPPTFQSSHYNHDVIVQTKTEPVFYVESEEEADQLGMIGLLATTLGRPAAVPPFQKDVLSGRTVIAVGRAGEDGESHVNAVKGEYQSVATVRTFMIEHPSGPTPPGYRLADWLRDTAGEDQCDWLMAVAGWERHPGRLPYIESGRPLGAVSGADRHEGRIVLSAVQQAPIRSSQVLVFGVGARGQVGTVTANDNPRPIRRQTRPGVVLSNDPAFGMEPDWLVQDVLPEAGTGMIYAPSMAGKSFIGIDLCYAVENGINWGGRQVKRGRAIYVSAEYSASICRRAKLQFQALGMDRPFTVIRADGLGHNLAGDGGDLERLMADIDYARGQDDVGLVFIDTFETIALGVEENSSSAVGQVWDYLAKIAARFNCFVLVAHHTGKSGENYRGSSTLMNRSETVIEVRVLDSGIRRMEIVKQRDGLSGLTADFILDTAPGTSCCHPVFKNDWRLKRTPSLGPASTSRKEPKERKGEQIPSAVLETLEAHFRQTGEAQIIKSGLANHPIILSCTSGKTKDARRKSIDRAIEALEGQGLIYREGLYIRLSETARLSPDMSVSCPDTLSRMAERTA